MSAEDIVKERINRDLINKNNINANMVHQMFPNLYDYENRCYDVDEARKAISALTGRLGQLDRQFRNSKDKHAIQMQDVEGIKQDLADLINEYRHLCKLHGEYETKHIPQGRYL